MLDDETKTLVKLYSSVIKMHNSNMRDLQRTWTMEKACNNCIEVKNKVQEGYLFWFHWKKKKKNIYIYIPMAI